MHASLLAADDGFSGEVTGRVVGVEQHDALDGSPMFILHVRKDRSAPAVPVLVTDRAVYRPLGLDPTDPNRRPPHGMLVRIEAVPYQEGYVAVGLRDPKLPPPPPPSVRADDPGLLSALVRIEARMAAQASFSVLRSLHPDDRRRPGAVQTVYNDFAELRRVREHQIGPDAERTALMRLLKSLRYAFDEEVKGSRLDSASNAAVVRARHLAVTALDAMAAARVEASDRLVSLSDSRAFGVVMAEFPGLERQMAAYVAWAAHHAIKSENPGNIHEIEIEGVKAALARSYSPGSPDPKADIADALDYAWRALVVIEEDVAANRIRQREIRDARSNVEAAMRWIGFEPGSAVEFRTERCLVRAADNEERLVAAIRMVMERGRKVDEVRRLPGGGVCVALADGGAVEMSKLGAIRVLDSNGKLAGFQKPGKEMVEFVNGRPCERALGSAMEAGGPDALRAAAR